MKHHINNFIAGGIDWIWRKRSTGLTLIRIGASILVMLLGAGLALDIIVPTSSGALQLSIDMDQGTPAYLVVFGLVVVTVLIVVGIFLLVGEQRRLGKKRVVAIELRGLRDTTGDPLKENISKNISGHREQILLNIRRSDGSILDPEDALQQVIHLPTSIANFGAGADRSDLAFVAGGLAPVPFSFLMGVLLDDEGRVTLMDWDRNGSCWRSISGHDDEDRFFVNGMDEVGDAEEIVISVSVSYTTNAEGISQAFTGQPVVSMTLSNLSTDAHWSEEKQAALAQQFFNTLRSLCGTKVKHVNLVLAAPNSIVIRLGRIYDKRNLPSVTVWQYENGQTQPYPWGVRMPVAGEKEKIVRV